MNCKDCETELPDLLLDPTSVAAAKAKNHLAGCNDCQKAFEELQSTFRLLDMWEAPELSPWFDQRLAVRLRQEQEAAPAGFWERMRSRLLFNTGRQLRPALAGGLALALLVGGGTAIDLSGAFHARGATVSATVQDLQILDRNDQAVQAMDLLQDDGPGDDGVPDGPTS